MNTCKNSQTKAHLLHIPASLHINVVDDPILKSQLPIVCKLLEKIPGLFPGEARYAEVFSRVEGRQQRFWLVYCHNGESANGDKRIYDKFVAVISHPTNYPQKLAAKIAKLIIMNYVEFVHKKNHWLIPLFFACGRIDFHKSIAKRLAILDGSYAEFITKTGIER
jgi:hypothetical protein